MTCGPAEGNGFMKKLSKSEKEKRRRDGINDHLETLRLLLVEDTCHKKLKNPRVKKVEILEGVVEFLKFEQRATNSSGPANRGIRNHEGAGGSLPEQQGPATTRPEQPLMSSNALWRPRPK